MAVGIVIPLFVAEHGIRPGTQLLTDYDWTDEEWADAKAFAAGGGGSSSAS